MRALILASLLVLASPLSMAKDATKLPPLDVVRAEQQEIQAQLKAGKGIYAQMPASTRSEVLRRQAALDALLTGKSSIDELSEAERVQVADSLAWITTTVARAEDDREICRSEKKTGSNRHTRVCRTVRQMREDREEARQVTGRAPTCANNEMCTN